MRKIFVAILMLSSLATSTVSFAAESAAPKATAAPLEAENPSKEAQDYPAILKKCAGNACCEASVHALEKSNGFVKNDPKKICPVGYQPGSMKCISSVRWCAPMKR